jgi:hypothetical protein
MSKEIDYSEWSNPDGSHRSLPYPLPKPYIDPYRYEEVKEGNTTRWRRFSKETGEEVFTI